MKKLTILFALLVAGSLSFGQMVIHEDFSDGQMPPDNWSISAQAGNWSAESTSNAGGNPPEARFSWTPQFNGSSYLISPSLDLSDNDTGVLLISFKHMIDHYGGAYTVGMAVRSNGGTWNTEWQVVNPTGDVPSEEVSVELNGDIVTSDDFQLAFFFSGASFNINFWYIDDIQAMIPQEFDLAVNSIDVPDIIAGPTLVNGSVVNLGTNVIESFDLNWQLDDTEVHNTSFTGLSLTLGETFHFEADDLMDAEPGTYDLHVSITNINGEASDDNPDNDILSKTIAVAYESVSRRPLFEMFTSSTCPPCATFNNGFFNNFTYDHADEITLIKYQMNWPGSGDPYYTPEGGVRRTYYGVTGVPSLFLEGNQLPTNGTVVNNALQQALQIPSFMAIEGNYDIDGDMISIEGTVMPYADFPPARLHVVIIESITYGNTGTNGETEFHHVMHKMMPNAQGTTVTLNAMEQYDFTFEHDMSGTNVEEMEDLMVVVFLQNHDSGEVYQSAYMSGDKIVSFNIPDGLTDAEPDITIEAIYDEPVTFLDGTVITNENVHELIAFDTEGGEAVPFYASIDEDDKVISIQSDEMLSFLTTYVVQMEDVLGANSEKTITGGSVSFTTRETYGTPVITFDVEDGATEIPLDHTFVITSNQQIRHANGQEISEENLHELINFHTHDGTEEVAFTAEINPGHTEIQVFPADMLMHNTTFLLELLPVMGIDGQVTDSHAVEFTTKSPTGTDFPGLSDIKIYPNPARNELNVETDGEITTLRLANLMGQVVYHTQVNASNYTINVSGLNPGIYFVQIHSDRGVTTHRIQVSR